MKLATMLAALCIGAAALTLTLEAPQAQEAKKKAASIKAGKGQKVCRVKMQYSGEVKTWLCAKEEPCCVWHEINYVKCGSTITGCL